MNRLGHRAADWLHASVRAEGRSSFGLRAAVPPRNARLSLVARLAVGMALASVGLGLRAAEAFAVFKSIDGGRTWARSDAGLPGRSRIHALGSTGDVLLAGTDSGLFASSDGARSWQSTGGVAGTSLRVLAFASQGRKVFAGTDGRGLLVSGDGGGTWAVDGAFPAAKVRCLLAHDGTVFAGTDAEGVLVSTESGRSWMRWSAGLPDRAQVFELAGVGGKLFAALYGRGLYAWDQPGRTWVKSGAVTPLALAGVQGTLIAGHNPGGLYWSADHGATWSKGIAGDLATSAVEPVPFDQSGALPAEAPVWALAAGGDRVFAGAAAGIYYSEDSGRTWNPAREGLPERGPGIAFLVKPEFVLAAAQIQ